MSSATSNGLSNLKKKKTPAPPGQTVDEGDTASDDPTQSMLGDDSTSADTTDATAGSTQSQMSAGQVTIKQKKNKHAYTVKWS